MQVLFQTSTEIVKISYERNSINYIDNVKILMLLIPNQNFTKIYRRINYNEYLMFSTPSCIEGVLRIRSSHHIYGFDK